MRLKMTLHKLLFILLPWLISGYYANTMAQQSNRTSKTEIHQPIKLTGLPAHMSAELGTAYTMTCRATGYPVPKITWEYQGFPIVSTFNGSKNVNFQFFEITDNGHQLKIQRITKNSSGTYKCYASNSWSKKWLQGQLSVTPNRTSEMEIREPIKLTGLPAHMNAELGTAYTMTCRATGFPVPNVTWEYQGFPIGPTFNGSKVMNFQFFEITHNGHQLKIQRITSHSGGTYKCYANNSWSRKWLQGELSVTLVKTPPTILDLRILAHEPVEHIYGKNKLRLECTVSGYPFPVIEWTFNGQKFEAGKAFRSTDDNATIFHKIKGNRLIIKKVRGKTDGDSSYYNSGRYRCIATNELGSTFFEKNIQIRVLGFFTHGNQKYDQPQKEYVTVGQSHIIPCPPHVKGYGTTYSWGTFSGRSSYLLKRYSHGQINNHLFQTRKGELVYAAVSEDDIRESQDIGGLRCILSNGFEEIVSKQVILWIYDSRVEMRKPRMVAVLPVHMNAELNTAYTMTCGATGYPIPKITWEYQGVPIVPRFNRSRELSLPFFQIIGNGYQLKIHRIAENSGGTYKCYAENSLGRVWVQGQLSVTHPPKWIKKLPEKINLKSKTGLALPCNASGNPRPTIQWFQNSIALKTDTRKKINNSSKTGSVLKIEEATSDDDGIYTCMAYNELDTITQSIYIKVES